MNEKLLVNHAKYGDKESFCMLYSLYKDRLYRYAYYRLANAQDAEDAVADTIVSAYENISSLRKNEAFCAWIFTILNKVCSRYIKQQIRQRECASMEELENSAAFSQIDADYGRDLMCALNILSSEEREIVLLSVVAGLNSSEISAMTKLRAGSVRSKLSRSLTKMRGFLGESYEKQ